MYFENTAFWTILRNGVRVQAFNGSVFKIQLCPLRRNDHSGGLIGAGGTQRSDWPARVLANDVSTRIDR